LGVPPGQLPDPGECRIWYPGDRPGRQPRPRSRPCEGIGDIAPAGSWIIYRPVYDRRLVYVRVVDDRRAGYVTRVWLYDYETYQFVREEAPRDDWRRQPPSVQPPPAQPPPAQPPPVQPPPAQPPPVQPPPAQPPPAQPPPAQPPTGPATLNLPPGQLPELGQCRNWIPGQPPGLQPRPKSRPCEGLTAPAGTWILYRPANDAKVVHVRVVDAHRAGVVVRVWVYDIQSKRLLREESP